MAKKSSGDAPVAPAVRRPLLVPHLCHVGDCLAEVQQDLFLCARHYEELPEKLRRELDRVQLDRRRWADRPGSEWSPAVTAAVNWLAVHGVEATRPS